MTSDNSVIIDIKNLSKTFGKFTALNKFNLQVNKGEVHGFLGPNGAGKSTTIRIILGLLKKTSGSADIFGEDAWSNAVELHEKLAYVPGDVNFWPNLTGGETIDILGNLRGGLNESRRKYLLQRFELDESKKFSSYSKGNRTKVALIAALACDVPLYIFDEPTSGLDPLMEKVFQEEVYSLKESGKTILLSSHIMSEVETLCDCVTIIRKGENAGNYTMDELRADHENLEKVFLSKYEED
ncbi:MAG: ABC transporter ATP-binding protein [Micrococcaceae bacterium]